MNCLIAIGQRAKQASTTLMTLSTKTKNDALQAIADELRKSEPQILAVNQLDMQEAKQQGMSTSMLDRLLLDSARLNSITSAVEKIITLPDPVGKVIGGETLPNGLEVIKRTVPLGVVGMIFEARPNVTVDSAVLCLKSGNACILRSGKEAIHSSTALVTAIRSGLALVGIPMDAVQLIEDTSRASATDLMQLNGYVDVLIPRGGKGLIQTVVSQSTVPVIETGSGVCHTYVDKEADFDMALSIIVNAKTSRPSVCNAMETLLVHQDIAPEFLSRVAQTLAPLNVEMRGCPQTMGLLGGQASPATQEDWSSEYGDLILAIKVVPTLEDAIKHIADYSTHHSECIVTSNYNRALVFTNLVDSAAVYVNASTRFTDGEEFGLGAEIGISTQKLHVRGPMGLSALTSYKYIVCGNGQIR